MKHKFHLIYFIIILNSLLVPGLTFAQTPNNSSIMINNGLYIMNGKLYSKNQISEILKTDPQAKELVSKSSSQNGFGIFTLAVGSILTIREFYEIYIYSTGKYGKMPDSVYLMTLLALGIDIAGVGILEDSKSSFSKAVDIYNMKHLTNKLDFNLHFGISSLGITLNF